MNSYIVVYGTGTDTEKKEWVEDAVLYCAAKLFQERELDKLKICIEFIPDLEKGVNAWWQNFDESHIIDVKNSLDGKSLFLTIAHEMVHVRQHERGTLQYRGDKVYWNDSRVYEDDDDIPWEREATETAETLLKLYEKEGKDLWV